MLIKSLLILNLSWGALPNSSETVTSESSPLEATSDTQIAFNADQNACLKHDSFLALNEATVINGKKYKAGTEFYFDDEGNAYDLSSKSDQPLPVDPNDPALNCNNLTPIPYDENTGEFGEYSLPIDFKVAGKGKPRKRKGGVTHCYRAVKAAVKHKVTLTGGSAYMAYAQLKAKGWKKVSYEAAPKGAICVFNKGGRVTASGGHKHGHIGIKGRSGIINPTAGFALKRPFMGCFHQ